MNERPPVDQILASLWPNGDTPTGSQVFGLFDGARDRRIEPLLGRGELAYQCLFAGKLNRSMRAAAPYIVHLEEKVRLTRELLELGWGNSWGIFTVVPWGVSTHQQHRHFRTLLRVRDERGRYLLFRFYDPRVLRVYLPTCTVLEAKEFFGPVPRIVTEGQTPDTLLSFAPSTSGVSCTSTALANGQTA